jgi:hypothetical protein
MNTKKLMMAAAAAALIAGAGGALAQEPTPGAPAERAAPKGPAAEHQNARPAPSATPGAGAQNRGREDNRQNAAEQRGERGNASEPQRRETSGQAPQNERQPRANEENGRATDQGKGARNEGAETRRNGNRNVGNNERQEQGARGNQRGEVQRGEVQRGEAQGARGNERGEVQGGPGGERRETTGQGAAAGRNINVNVTPEQRTRIHDVIIREGSAPRVDHVDFNLSVGTRVPRSVRFVEVPREIVEIEPAWRGYDYFMVGERFVIVDPVTLDIVAVLVL